MRGLKYRLQGLIIKDTMKYIVVFATKNVCVEKSEIFINWEGGTQVGHEPTKPTWVRFYFYFLVREERGLFLRTIL